MDSTRFSGTIGLLLAVTMVLANGCTGGTKAPTGTIKGKLTYKGSPVPNGTVVQFSGGRGGGNGTVTADGTFTVQGIEVGKYQVSVAPPPAFPSDPRAAMEASLKATPAGGETKAVPEKYLRPETSGETFEVKAGANTFSLDMKD
jgi:hypothetical protein